jgi:hypothetical protein
MPQHTIDHLIEFGFNPGFKPGLNLIDFGKVHMNGGVCRVKGIKDSLYGPLAYQRTGNADRDPFAGPIVDRRISSIMISCLEKINSIVTDKINDTVFLGEASRPDAA